MFFIIFHFIDVFALVLLGFLLISIFFKKIVDILMRKKLLTAVIVVSCRHSNSGIAQSALGTPTTIHFVEISGWSTHDTMNYSDAPAKLDELQASHGFL